MLVAIAFMNVRPTDHLLRPFFAFELLRSSKIAYDRWHPYVLWIPISFVITRGAGAVIRPAFPQILGFIGRCSFETVIMWYLVDGGRYQGVTDRYSLSGVEGPRCDCHNDSLCVIVEPGCASYDGDHLDTPSLSNNKVFSDANANAGASGGRRRIKS